MTDRQQEQLLGAATDRFERRLAEECGTLRAEIGELRVATLERHHETRLEIAGTRLEIADTRLEVARLRGEMSDQFAAERVHSETLHRELLKWAFVFWVGQAAVVAGIVSAFT